MYYQFTYPSPIGELQIVTAENSVIGLWIKEQKYFGDKFVRAATYDPDRELHLLVTDWLDRYFAGKHPSPSELPLEPIGTPFQQLIWMFLCEIPYGQTVCYGDLATRAANALGKAHMASQAVGSAVGHNPISIIIPCHRVIGKNGSLTGYAGGIAKKQWLLAHEQTSTQL